MSDTGTSDENVLRLASVTEYAYVTSGKIVPFWSISFSEPVNL